MAVYVPTHVTRDMSSAAILHLHVSMVDPGREQRLAQVS